MLLSKIEELANKLVDSWRELGFKSREDLERALEVVEGANEKRAQDARCDRELELGGAARRIAELENRVQQLTNVRDALVAQMTEEEHGERGERG